MRQGKEIALQDRRGASGRPAMVSSRHQYLLPFVCWCVLQEMLLYI